MSAAYLSQPDLRVVSGPTRQVGDYFIYNSKFDLSYQFNKRVIHHLFCSQCGVASFARGRGPDGKEMVAINVRCLDGVDVASLKLTPYDGKNA